jgi:hypothetical protein
MAKIVIVDLISSTLIGELRDGNLVNYFYAVHGRDKEGNHAVQLIPPVIAGLTSACIAKDTFDKYGPVCLEGIDAMAGQIFEISDVTGRPLLFTYYDMRYGVYGIPNLMVSDVEKGKVEKLIVDG